MHVNLIQFFLEEIQNSENFPFNIKADRKMGRVCKSDAISPISRRLVTPAALGHLRKFAFVTFARLSRGNEKSGK